MLLLDRVQDVVAVVKRILYHYAGRTAWLCVGTVRLPCRNMLFVMLA
jgi:hypothetical protein